MKDKTNVLVSTERCDKFYQLALALLHYHYAHQQGGLIFHCRSSPTDPSSTVYSWNWFQEYTSDPTLISNRSFTSLYSSNILYTIIHHFTRNMPPAWASLGLNSREMKKVRIEAKRFLDDNSKEIVSRINLSKERKRFLELR